VHLGPWTEKVLSLCRARQDRVRPSGGSFPYARKVRIGPSPVRNALAIAGGVDPVRMHFLFNYGFMLWAACQVMYLCDDRIAQHRSGNTTKPGRSARQGRPSGLV
jgi:hypothetical protein